MVTSSSTILTICGIVFLIIDLLIFFICLRWWQKRKAEEKLQSRPQSIPLIRQKPLSPPPTALITAQTSIDDFQVPLLKDSKDDTEETPKNILESGIDPILYGGSQRVTLKNKPKIGFQFFYDFRTTQLKVTLTAIKNIQRYTNEQVVVTILMSNSKISYQSSKVEGPDAVLNEEFPFPMDSMEISSDPPITCKFNVWHVDKQNRKTPYGYVELKVENVLSQMSNIISDKGKTLWRNVVISDYLTDVHLIGELMVTLSYLSAAQRIGCTVVKAKDLILTANDKDIHIKISLLVRDVEQQSVVTNFTEITQNPEFNQEFIFRFGDLRNASIDGIALRFDVYVRETGLLGSSRILGRCVIGNSNAVERPGREHWVTALTSRKSVTQWHQLKDVSDY